MTQDHLEPEKIKNVIHGTDSETVDLIRQLVKERLLTPKYVFDCECGCRCAVHERALFEKGAFSCEECERTYSFNEIIEIANIVYDVEKRDYIDFLSSELNFKQALIDVDSKKGVYKKMENSDKIKIFIGSSSEDKAKHAMENVSIILSELGCEACQWNSQTTPLFRAGDYTLESLFNILDNFDAAIFIFNEDDLSWFNKSYENKKTVVRDNVILEYGMFIGRKGKNNAAILRVDKPKIPSDLEGVTYIEMDDNEAVLKRKLQAWIETIQK